MSHQVYYVHIILSIKDPENVKTLTLTSENQNLSSEGKGVKVTRRRVLAPYRGRRLLSFVQLFVFTGIPSI